MSRIVMVAALMLLIGYVVLPPEADAVAFKMANYSSHTLRMRIYDRGEWRPWVQCPPGFWGDVAKSVKRTEHSVEIDVWTGNGWRPYYRNHHGSRAFTRVVQALDAGQGIVFAWWDEPPGCRDWPPRPWVQEGTCLRRAGWYKGELTAALRRAAKMAAMAVVGG